MHYARLMSCKGSIIVLDILHALVQWKIIYCPTATFAIVGFEKFNTMGDILEFWGFFFFFLSIVIFLFPLELFYCWIAFRSICSVAVSVRHHWETLCHQSHHEVHHKSSAAAGRDWYITVFCHLDLKQKESTGYYRDVSNTKNILRAFPPPVFSIYFHIENCTHLLKYLLYLTLLTVESI